jgi:hypothetical protein
MTNNPSNIVDVKTMDALTKVEKKRKSYAKPHLNVLGDLRDLTLGPTLGTLESGSPGTRQTHRTGPQPIR